MAYDICQPSWELPEEESALAQCFMAIAGFVRKMSGTDTSYTDRMNRYVAHMGEEALKYNKVQSVHDKGEEDDIFIPDFIEIPSDITALSEPYSVGCIAIVSRLFPVKPGLGNT